MNEFRIIGKQFGCESLDRHILGAKASGATTTNRNTPGKHLRSVASGSRQVDIYHLDGFFRLRSTNAGNHRTKI